MYYGNWPVARSSGGYFCIVHFLLFACLPALFVFWHSLRSLVIGRSIDQCPRYIKSLWVRGRRRGHHPAPHRIPINEMYFFLAATAMELAVLLGYGRSQYTGNCANVTITTFGGAAGDTLVFIVPRGTVFPRIFSLPPGIVTVSIWSLGARGVSH